MKNTSKKEFVESMRPSKEAKEAIDYCLKRLYEEREKSKDDYVVDQLIYEELIGTLLLARDECK